MKHTRWDWSMRLLLCSTLLSTLGGAACSDDDDDDGPTELTVVIDENCEGICSNIDVKVDGATFALGLDAGGEYGKEMTPGDVVITATSANGCEWNTQAQEPNTIPDEGLIKTLSCPIDGPPILKVTLDENCEGLCSNVDILLDNTLAGRIAEAGDDFSTEVEEGPITLEAYSEEGCVWSVELQISKLGLEQTLACPPPGD